MYLYLKNDLLHMYPIYRLVSASSALKLYFPSNVFELKCFGVRCLQCQLCLLWENSNTNLKIVVNLWTEK